MLIENTGFYSSQGAPKRWQAYYRYWILAFVCLASMLGWQEVHAHAPNENYVWVNVEQDHIVGRFEVNIGDVRTKLGIDIDAEGATRLEGVVATQDQLRNYFRENFSIIDQGVQLEIVFGPSSVFEPNPKFLQYPFTINSLPSDNNLVIRNTIFLTPDLMKDDRLHRSLIVVEYNKAASKDFGGENVALVFSPSNPEQSIDLSAPAPILKWQDFLWQGILHISVGLDHVLFVVLLLLTAVLKPVNNQWQPQPRFVGALWKTLKIVTIFTFAHSITLTLAALDLVSVNTSVVESIIALSIIAVAIHNLSPKLGSHTWILIFVFGLFHGLGFASVMGDLQFRTVLIERILVMFNVGVELGQMAIVCTVFPVLFLLRKKAYYHKFIVTPISIVAALVAAYWALQRTGVIGG